MGTCLNSASLALRKSHLSGRESFSTHGDHTYSDSGVLIALGMAFSEEEEEVSPQENYGGGRQTISIFGCGARFC